MSQVEGWARTRVDGLGDCPLCHSLGHFGFFHLSEPRFPPLPNGNNDRLTARGCVDYMRQAVNYLTECLAHKETSVR